MAETQVRRDSGRAVGIFLVIAALLVVAVGSGSHFGGGSHITNMDSESAASVLAARAHELRVAPKITDEILLETLDAVRAKAADGEVEAAAFIFELAARQRTHDQPSPESDNAVAHTDP